MKIGVLFLTFLFIVSFVSASTMEISIDLDFEENETNSSEELEAYIPGGSGDGEDFLNEESSINTGSYGADSGVGSENKFVEALNDSDLLLFGVVLIAVILLVGLGVAVYFLIRGRK
jgi:hypothetical protein